MFARHVVLRRHCRIGTFTPFSSGFENNSLFRGQISSYSDSLLQQIIRGYAFKSDLKIKWVRPTKIPSHTPEKSGDLEPLPPVDGKKFPPELLESEEFQTADDLTRRVLTLEFNRRKATMQILRRDMMCRVKRHNLDVGSAETKVAEMTAGIRNLQQVMEEFPRDKKLKVKLNELIDRRKKTLKYIRRWDYKRFEWLLEKLNIVYKPPPSEFHWITRKDSLRKLTDKHCEDIKQARLAAYKASLDAQKISFLQEKIAKLQWICKEEEECGVESTVTQEDIDKVIAHLKEIEISQSNQTNTLPEQISKQKQTITTSTC